MGSNKSKTVTVANASTDTLLVKVEFEKEECLRVELNIKRIVELSVSKQPIQRNLEKQGFCQINVGHALPLRCKKSRANCLYICYIDKSGELKQVHSGYVLHSNRNIIIDKRKDIVLAAEGEIWKSENNKNYSDAEALLKFNKEKEKIERAYQDEINCVERTYQDKINCVERTYQDEKKCVQRTYQDEKKCAHLKRMKSISDLMQEFNFDDLPEGKEKCEELEMCPKGTDAPALV